MEVNDDERMHSDLIQFLIDKKHKERVGNGFFGNGKVIYSSRDL